MLTLFPSLPRAPGGPGALFELRPSSPAPIAMVEASLSASFQRQGATVIEASAFSPSLRFSGPLCPGFRIRTPGRIDPSAPAHSLSGIARPQPSWLGAQAYNYILTANDDPPSGTPFASPDLVLGPPDPGGTPTKSAANRPRQGPALSTTPPRPSAPAAPSMATDMLAVFFRWQGVTSYNGSADPHEWLEDIEEEMARLGYRPCDYVDKVSEKLESAAKTWYRAWKVLQLGPLLWDNFKTSFLEQFGFSSSDWTEQLLDCAQQPGEGVAAYSNRFLTLARRAQQLTDPSIVRAYVRGLRKSASVALDLFRPATGSLQQTIRDAIELISKHDWRALLLDDGLNDGDSTGSEDAGDRRMARLSLNMRDRSDGRRDQGRDRHRRELNMMWRDHNSSECGSVYDSDSDVSEGELLASELKRIRDFDLGQRLPRSREPLSPDTRMEVDRRPPRHYTAGGRFQEEAAAKLPRPYQTGGDGWTRPLIERPVKAAEPPPRVAAASLPRAPPAGTASAAAAVGRGVREAAARPLPDADRPRASNNTRAAGLAPLPVREEPRAAPARAAVAAPPVVQATRAAPPDPKPAVPRVAARTDPAVARTEETQVADDVFAKIAAHSISLAKSVQCDSRAILAKVGGKCLGLARSASGGAYGSSSGAKGGLLAEAQPAGVQHVSTSEEDTPSCSLQQPQFQICRVSAACYDVNGGEVGLRTCVDTGASNCVITRHALSELGLLNSIRPTRIKFYHANGTEEPARGKVKVVVCLAGLTRTVEMYVLDAANYDVLLGNSFLGPIRADISYSRGVLEYDDDEGGRHTTPIAITRGGGEDEPPDLLARLGMHVYVASTSPGSGTTGTLTPSVGGPGLSDVQHQMPVATVAEARDQQPRQRHRDSHTRLLLMLDGSEPDEPLSHPVSALGSQQQASSLSASFQRQGATVIEASAFSPSLRFSGPLCPGFRIRTPGRIDPSAPAHSLSGIARPQPSWLGAQAYNYILTANDDPVDLSRPGLLWCNT
eukprot:XP_001700749.1 predicted protein [Chlamydomonas reinhardtii]